MQSGWCVIPGDVILKSPKIGLLIIDEVGVQYGTEGEQVIMFDIINRRYRDAMPTILITNLGKEGFKKYLGERSFDRLRENGIWVPFDWESHRGKRAA
jgi:DNA replication protein DnaC